jgi:hypothetical protein
MAPPRKFSPFKEFMIGVLGLLAMPLILLIIICVAFFKFSIDPVNFARRLRHV